MSKMSDIFCLPIVGSTDVELFDSDDTWIGEMFQDEAGKAAALAVNSHDQLVDLAERTKDLLTKIIDEGDINHCVLELGLTLKAAEKALAAAKGE